MKVYSPAEIAAILNIKQPTLRKYSIMLEERGHKIERNSQNHRYYTDKDLITLRRIITGKNSGITLDEVIDNVVNLSKNNAYTNNINNAEQPNNNDIQQFKEMVNEKFELQNEVIKELIKKIDEQQEYIKNRDEQRDRNLMEAMDQIMEQKQAQKEIASAQEAEQKKVGGIGYLKIGGFSY